MSKLPLAITRILPALAADGGRGRADTLMVILGPGPDMFRQNLAGIDVALGTDSPGVTRLVELVQMAEDAVSTSKPTVPKQHVISKVLMRRWVEPIPPHGHILLGRYRFAKGSPDQMGVEGVGYIKDFVPVDSKTTEALWWEIEDKLGPATEAALASANAGSPMTTADRATLKNAVALHYVRNPQTVTITNTAFADSLEATIAGWMNTGFAEEAFYRHFGLHAVGKEARRLGVEAAQGRMIELHKQGGLFRLSVQRLYERVCDRLDARGVEIILPASPAKEFLIGDLPAITINDITGAAGIAAGIAIDNADRIIMPLAPGLLVAVGPPDGMRTATDDEVDKINELQVKKATDYVLYRPGAGMGAAVANWRIS